MVATGQTSPGLPFYLQFPYSHYPKIGANLPPTTHLYSSKPEGADSHHDLLVKISSKASSDARYVAMIHKVHLLLLPPPPSCSLRT